MTTHDSISYMLLTRASQGQPITLEGDNLYWLQMLIHSGHVGLHCKMVAGNVTLDAMLTPKGRAFLESIDE